MQTENTDSKRIIAATVAELVMVVGYFLYECFVLGYGLGALASVTGNCLQALAAVVISSVLCNLLYFGKSIKNKRNNDKSDKKE